MRSWMAKLGLVAALLISSVMFASTAAKADAGNPFNPGDGRYNPLTGDRIAVYCTSSYIDVWGVDNDNVGTRLALYQLSDLTKAQAKPLAQSLGDLGTVTLYYDGPVAYHVAWTGGSTGATGADGFVKYFGCGLS